MPDKIPHFIGRQKECQVILEHVTNGVTRLVDVWGPPAFGKTSVAINVAHQLREMEIPVFFTSLRGMTRKDDLVSKLLSMFADAQQVFHVLPSHRLIQCLQQLQNPFVLVLDNADDLLESEDAKLKEDVLRFVEEILTTCTYIKLLFTTRESLDYLSHKIPIHNERVGVLDVASSVSLVQSLSPNVSDDNCRTIVRVCGQVPLAMRLMCSIMREENVSLNELLEELTISPIVEVLNSESFPEDVRLKTIINKSFERLTGHERAAFVSLAVFPGSFATEEATAVLDLETLRQTKKVIRSLQRKSLVDCSEDFSSVTIHSLLRSFIDERRRTDQETRAIFLEAQHRFYSHHISRFEMANEGFLTGQSNKALVAFLNHRDSIMLSLINGPSDNELYPKAVEVLSKAELFLFALLPVEKSLFTTIYDTAVKEAQKRQEVNDECNLLAAKSFSHWGWFSSDHQACDDSFPTGLTDSADCPAKLLCYFGIYQLLRGKLDEGVSSLQCAVDSLSNSCDETILKQLVYDVLVISYRKKGEHKMASHFSHLHRIIGKASSVYVGVRPTEETLSSMKDNAFCFGVIFNLLNLILSERKTLNSGVFHAVVALCQSSCSLILDPFLECSWLEHMEHLMKSIEPITQLNANELEEQFLVPTNMAIPLANLFRIHPSNTTLVHFNQLFETSLNILFEYIEDIEENDRDVLLSTCKPVIQPLKDVLWGAIFMIFEGHRGIDFQALASIYDLIAKLMYFTKDYSTAISFHQCAIKVREEAIGDHMDTSSSLTNIGCVHFKMNNEIEGVKSFQRAFELRERLDIYDHVDTANVYCTLGDKHLTLGNYDKAIEAHRQALKLRKKHLGEHPLTGATLHKIAEVYYAKGIHSATSYSKLQATSYKEALTFCKQASDMRLDLLGKHMDTAQTFHTLGKLHYDMGDLASAAEAFCKESDMRSTVLGDHNTPYTLEDTFKSYLALGLVRCDMGDHKGALEPLQNALQLARNITIDDQPGIAHITNKIGEVYLKMDDNYSAKKQFQDAVELYKKLPDEDESTATSYHNLARAHLALGSYPEALECFKQASNMRLEVLGQHGHTANSFHMLGVVHHQINDFTSAVEAFRTASDLRSALLDDHQDTAESYHSIGLAHSGMGNLNEFLESFKKALQLRNKLSVGYHDKIADNIYHKTTVYGEMGDHESAREQFQNAVDLYETLQDECESPATSYHNLATAHLALGSYPEALECFKQASTMGLEVLGQHVHTANSFHMLGVVYLKTGEFTSAVEAFQTASDMRSTLLGDHQDTAQSYDLLGLAQCEMADFKGALESLQKALQLARKLSIGDQPGIADITSEIGEVYLKMGDYYSAREQFQNAVELYNKLLDKHESTAASYHNLAVTHLALGSYLEAVECSKQASTMRLEVLGQHEHTANSFHMLGVLYNNTGDFKSAVEAFQTATDMRSTLLGDHEDTAESCHALGLAHSGMKNLNAALESFKKSQQQMKKLSVGDHCKIADNINDMGTVYYKMGDYKSAREHFQNAVHLYEKLLHKRESTSNSYHNLAITYLAMESYPEALECFMQASTMRLEVLGQRVHTANSFHMLGVVHQKTGDFKSAVKAFQTASDMRSTLLGDHQDTATTGFC